MTTEKIEFSGNIMQEFLATGGVFLFVGEMTEANLQLAQAIRDLPRGCEVAMAVVNQDLIDAINRADGGKIAPAKPQNPVENALAWLMADFNRIIATNDARGAQDWMDEHGYADWWMNRVNGGTLPQVEIDRIILEQFHYAYESWMKEEHIKLFNIALNTIYPVIKRQRKLAIDKG